MTTDAPTEALDALFRHRTTFIEKAGAFLTETVEAYAPIEELIRAHSKAHQAEITELSTVHAAEIQKLGLIATTATAAADEKARQSTAKALAAAEEAFRDDTERAVAEAVAEAAVAHQTSLGEAVARAVSAAEESAASRTRQAVGEAENAHALLTAEAVRAALDAAAGDFAARTALAVQDALNDAEAGFQARSAQDVAEAVSAADRRISEHLARERQRAIEEVDSRHEESLRVVRTLHANEIESLRQDFANQSASLREGLESESVTAIRAAVAQARESWDAEFERKLAAVTSGHEAQVADLVRQHDNRVAGVQTMMRAAESGRIAAESRLGEVKAALLEAESRQEPANEPVASEIAPEVDALLYPNGQASPDEALALELEATRASLGEANAQIGSLQDQLRQATGNTEELQGRLAGAGITRDNLEREVRRLGQELEAIKEAPAVNDPTAASMKIARAEAHAIVCLVADANPQATLVEAADLVGAALTGRTEMALQLPSPVLLGSAA